MNARFPEVLNQELGQCMPHERANELGSNGVSSSQKKGGEFGMDLKPIECMCNLSINK